MKLTQEEIIINDAYLRARLAKADLKLVREIIALVVQHISKQNALVEQLSTVNHELGGKGNGIQ